MSATELAQRIRKRELSCVEVMRAHLAQIERVNPTVNAIVTLVAEPAMAQAQLADAALARGEEVGPLHGLPVVHKDLVLTKGMRTTFGSPIHQDFVPEMDSLIVERLKAAGAISVGKSNVPEFGAGSQTFNAVFGATLNPYDPSKTCGGSSGGAAVALACGMVPLADGSDLGGSLRNPASFCNVVGLRPSAGRVPSWPVFDAWNPLSVLGPMARTVQDAALMLSAIAGPDPRSPISITQPGTLFAQALARDFRGTRLAWSSDFGGLPIEPDVVTVLENQRHVFEELGMATEHITPDFAGVDEVFKTLRAYQYQLSFGHLLQQHRAQLKDTVIWNIEEGARLSGAQVGRAQVRHGEIYHRLREFMEEYEFLALPVVQVVPFDVRQPYVTEINGVAMPTYLDWMKSCYYISVTGLPAISVPCGFTPDGLPVGLQLVGRHQDDFGVLQLAHAFEQRTLVGRRRPPLAVIT